MIEKLTEIMKELFYERNFKNSQKSKCMKLPIENYTQYEITFYPRNYDGDSAYYWIRYYFRPYDYETVGIVHVDAFDSIEDMAKVLFNMMETCKFSKGS